MAHTVIRMDSSILCFRRYCTSIPSFMALVIYLQWALSASWYNLLWAKLGSEMMLLALEDSMPRSCCSWTMYCEMRELRPWVNEKLRIFIGERLNCRDSRLPRRSRYLDTVTSRWGLRISGQAAPSPDGKILLSRLSKLQERIPLLPILGCGCWNQ